MTERRTALTRTRALVGLASIVIVLLLGLAWLEGPDGRSGCAPLAPVSAESVPAPALDPPREPDLDAATPPVASADAPTSAPSVTKLHGRVLDKTTLEPVPWVDVEISGSSGKVRTSTGADGSFTTELVLGIGTLSAQVTDDGADVGDVQTRLPLRDEAAGWDVAVPIGPTYPIAGIDGHAPAPSAHWSFELVDTQFPCGTAGRIDTRADKLAVLGTEDDRRWGKKTLRTEGDVPFVRWPRARTGRQSAFSELRVRSDTLSAKGRACVAGTAGIQPQVSFATAPFAILTGAIVLPLGERTADVHVLALESASDGRAGFDHVPYFAEVASDSNYEFETPAFTSIRLVPWARMHACPSALVDVHAGRTIGPDLQLTAAPEMQASSFALPSDVNRRTHSQPMLRLRLEDARGFAPAWLIELSRRGEVELPSLPAASFDLESIGFDEAPLPLAARTLVPTRAAMLEAVRSDAPPTRVHRVVARANGAEGRADCFITAGPAGSLFTTEGDAPGPWPVPIDDPAVFCVWAKGFAPALLTEAKFVASEAVSIAQVNLSPGWGVLLAFRAGDPKERDPQERNQRLAPAFRRGNSAKGLSAPVVPGVRVESGGIVLGTSDEDGCVLVKRAARPDEVSLVASGWKMTGIEPMPGPGSRWWVWMKRDP